jgi:hypothetical protein
MSAPSHSPQFRVFSRRSVQTNYGKRREVLCVTSIAGPNGMRNCTRDEGGPFEAGSQVLVSSHRKLPSSRAMVVSVAESRVKIPAGETSIERSYD